jgi:hypothetical protein
VRISSQQPFLTGWNSSRLGVVGSAISSVGSVAGFDSSSKPAVHHLYMDRLAGAGIVRTDNEAAIVPVDEGVASGERAQRAQCGELV